MADIIKAPMRYRRPHVIVDVWSQPEPTDEMTWTVCVYAKGANRGVDEGCQQCPQWEDGPNYGKIKRGCRGWAEETCRVVMAFIDRPTIKTDSEKG